MTRLNHGEMTVAAQETGSRLTATPACATIAFTEGGAARALRFGRQTSVVSNWPCNAVTLRT